MQLTIIIVFCYPEEIAAESIDKKMGFLLAQDDVNIIFIIKY